MATRGKKSRLKGSPAVSAVEGRCDRGEDAELRGAKEGPGRKRERALREVLSRATEVGPGVPVLEDRYDLRTEVGVLLPHDAIGTRRQRRAGEDPRTLPGADRPCRHPPRRELLHQIVHGSR